MDQLDVFWTSYIALAVIFTIVELVRPARKLRYKKVLPLDLVGLAVYQLAIFPLAAYVTDPVYGYLPITPALAASLAAAWLPLRVLAFFLLADLGSYWMHRWLHTRPMWRFHRWHHSSTHLYWLSGVRATVPQQILFNLPFVLALLILAGVPPWIYLAITIEGVLRNNWMHMNVTWRSNWLERVFVTPRYHHIHHSADGAQHEGNYGSLFSLWDRLFGTYIDPDGTRPKTFGTGEKRRDPVLLIIGI